MSQQTNWIRIATYIALISAMLGAVADVLLLYNPAGGYELQGDLKYAFLLDLDANRVMIGHFLGIFFIPLEMLGLFQVHRALKPAGAYAWAIVISALYLGFPGVVYHATVAFSKAFIDVKAANPQLAMEESWNHVIMLSDPLAAVLPIGFIIMSALLIYTILKQPTKYPKWMAACTPLTFYVICILAYLVVPGIGNVLAPAGFNLSFMLFFIFSLKAEQD